MIDFKPSYVIITTLVSACVGWNVHAVEQYSCRTYTEGKMVFSRKAQAYITERHYERNLIMRKPNEADSLQNFYEYTDWVVIFEGDEKHSLECREDNPLLTKTRPLGAMCKNVDKKGFGMFSAKDLELTIFFSIEAMVKGLNERKNYGKSFFRKAECVVDHPSTDSIE